MASIQCIKCKSGIHYHGEPEGIEYVFIRAKDWDNIISSRFDPNHKLYLGAGSSPMLFQTDTIEADFEDLIGKAWKCPKCGTIMTFDKNGRVIQAFEIDDSKKRGKSDTSSDYVVFDDYSWNILTESAISNSSIPKQFKPTFCAKLTESNLVITNNDGVILKKYIQHYEDNE